MINSMTAFGRQEANTQWGVLSWEARTVNHRYLDISLRLPEDFRALETKVREIISNKVTRGKLDAVFRFKPMVGVATKLSLDSNLVTNLLKTKMQIEGMMENPARVSALELLKWPGVMQVVEADIGQLHVEILHLLETCMESLGQSRLREGEKMKQILEQKCSTLEDQVQDVKKIIPQILQQQQQKLRDRLESLKTQVDQSRLEQELVYMAQKIDIQEELDRLESHLGEVKHVLGQSEPVGRRLDFLMQELNREANTLGSKSADARTTRVSVELKVIIEQMREQIQNIE